MLFVNWHTIKSCINFSAGLSLFCHHILFPWNFQNAKLKASLPSTPQSFAIAITERGIILFYYHKIHIITIDSRLRKGRFNFITFLRSRDHEPNRVEWSLTEREKYCKGWTSICFACTSCARVILSEQSRLLFTIMWPYIVTNFFIIKPTRCTNFTNLFWLETLHVSHQWRTEGGFGVFKPPTPRNSEDIGGDLDRTSEKNRRLDLLL